MIEFKALILIGTVLFAAGLFAGAKLRGRRRLWLILPGIVLMGFFLYVALGIHEDNRRAEEIFPKLGVETALTLEDVEALRALAQSSRRVREGTLRLAFLNPTNAVLALPRLEFLLQSALQLDPDGKRRRGLWDDVVQPALKRQPSTEVLALSAATAKILRLGSNQVGQVVRPLLSALGRDTRADLRYKSACILVSMAARVPADQTVPLSRFLVQEARALTNLNPGDAVISLRRIGVLADGISRLTNHQTSDLVQPITRYVLAEMERETNTMRIAKLGSELGLFKANLKPTDAERALRFLIQAMGDRRPKYVVPELGDAAQALVANLVAEQVEPIVEQIVSEMAREADGFILDPFFRPLAPLANQLDPEANARFVQNVVGLMIQGASQEALRRFSGALTSAVERVSSAQAVPLAEKLFAYLLKVPNSVTRATMIPTFTGLLNRLGPEEAKPLAARLEAGLNVLLTRGDPSELDEQVTCLAVVASRLDAQEASAFAERMIVLLEEHKGHTLVLSRLLAAVGSHLSDDTRKRAAQCVVAATKGPTPVVRLSALLETLDILHASPTEEERSTAIERIVLAMEKHHDAGSLTPVMRQIAPLIKSLSADQARRLGELLLVAAQDPGTTVIAFDALRDFSEKLDPDQSKRAIDLLLTRIEKINPGTTSWLLRALTPFAGQLESDAATSLMDRLLTIMEKQGYTVTTMGIAANLPVVADRLDQAQARVFAERITVALENTTDSLALNGLMGRQRMGTITDGWPVYSQFVARSEAGTDSWRLAVLCRTLSALLAKLEKGDTKEFGRRVAVRFEQQGWHAPVVFDNTMPLVLQHAPEQSLANILKAPLAVGGLRQMVLRAWESKTGKSFDDDIWAFVSWAATAESTKGLRLGEGHVPTLTRNFQ